MSQPSLYTPWAEPAESLAARTVGRAAELTAIELGVSQLAGGGHPLPLYFFGARGTGKSHLMALGVARARPLLAAAGITIATVGEDVAQAALATDLIERINAATGGPQWMRWRGRPDSAPHDRQMVVVEGLDRHLRNLPASEQKLLRAWLRDHPGIWFVATGARLPDDLTAADGAFYNHFSNWPLLPLGNEAAAELVDRLVGDTITSWNRWPVRRLAVLTLAGGNPRSVTALTEAVKAAPGEDLADRLLSVLDNATGNYHIRFNDLTAKEQRLVELLAQAPRELGPTEVAAILGGESATWSTQAGRLAEAGVVRIQQDGRRSWYALTEPLFRYWMEYRSAPWSDTRIAWLGRLLELVLGPDELVTTWDSVADEAIRRAALEAVKRRPEARQLAWDSRVEAIDRALALRDWRSVAASTGAAAAVAPGPRDAWRLVVRLVQTPASEAVAALVGPLISGGCHALGGLVEASTKRATNGKSVVVALADGARAELRRVNATSGPDGSEAARALVLLLDKAIRRMDPRGGMWVASPDERGGLAGVPGLRARLLRHGRLPAHPALLQERDLLEAAIRRDDPDLGDLLWVSIVKGTPALSARVLSLIDAADTPSLTWCPWPGRSLDVDGGALSRIVARSPTHAALSWLGAVASADTTLLNGAIVGIAAQHPVPPPRPDGRLDLSFTAVALRGPDEFERLAAALGAAWQPFIERAVVLRSQLLERERGPLHPELARVADAILARV